MPFAYITQQGAILKKKNRQFVLYKSGEKIATFGMTQLDSLMLCGNIQISAAAIKSLASHGIDTAFLSRKGKLLGYLSGPRSGSIQLRMVQYALQNNEELKLNLARQFVRDKFDAMLDVFDRYRDNYVDLRLREARHKIREAREGLSEVLSLPSLLGVEGNASAVYWNGFRQLNRSQLGFYGRSRRPPRDEINALLSLGYVILSNELRSLIESMGMDSCLGIYHRPKDNRPSLALDLVEPFRHLIIDRMVLRLVNRGQIKPKDFSGEEATGFILETKGWKTFLAEYEKSMLGSPSGFLQDLYPQVGSWRELIQKQCLQLKRTLSGYAATEEEFCKLDEDHE